MTGSMKKDDEPITLKETFERDPETVWKAITDPEQMREWFFEAIPAFEPVVGFEVEFNVESGDRNFPHQWRVTKVVPRELIEYSWKYGGYLGDSFVSFKLEPRNGSTILWLSHTVTEDFQEDVPEFTRESGIGGWSYFIKQRLKEYLE